MFKRAENFMQHAIAIHEQFKLVEVVDHARYGKLCELTGKKSEAVRHYEMAIDHTQDPFEKARLFSALAETHVTNLDTAKGIAAINQAFRAIGWSSPSVWKHGPACVWGVIVHSLHKALRIRIKPASGKYAQELKTIITLHEQSGFVQFFNLNVPGFTISLLRVLRHASRLGDSAEIVRLYCTTIVLVSTLKQLWLARLLYREASAIAERLGDPSLIARAEAYGAYSFSFAGREVLAERNAKAVMLDFKETLSAEDYVYLSGVYMSSMLLRGFPRECLRCAEDSIRHLEKILSEQSGLKEHYLTWAYSYAMASLAVLGRAGEGQQYRKILENYFERHPDDRYHLGILLNNRLQVLLEQGDYSKAVDEEVVKHDQLNLFVPITLLHVRHFYVAKAYLRLEQYRRSDLSGRRLRKKAFKHALRQLFWASDNPMFWSHYHVLRAHFLSTDEKFTSRKIRKITRALARSQAAADISNNPTVFFEILICRARIEKRQNARETAATFAQMAADMCARYGWESRRRRVEEEFAIESQVSKANSFKPQLTSSGISSYTSAGGGGSLVDHAMQALINASLAAAKSTNSTDQAIIALDEIIRVTGGERALLFLSDEVDGELAFFHGRDGEKQSLPSLNGFSTTIVHRVWDNQVAEVMSGGSEGEYSASASIVAHDLRSIMAAPISVSSKRVGVIYVDSRFAKGIFGTDDCKLLQAIGTQVGIAIESARSTRREVERAALDRDLEVSGAVQKLLIPSNSAFDSARWRLHYTYKPAAKSGGDWIWYEELSDGGLKVILGDVTGHGPGPAMITAMVAGIYRSLPRELPMTQVFQKIHDGIRAIGSNEFWLSCMGLEYSPLRSSLTVTNAGMPLLAICEPSATDVRRVSMISSPLGSTQFDLNVSVLDVSTGMRLLLASDGAFEFDHNGRQFGMRNLTKLFHSKRDEDIHDQHQFVEERILDMMEHKLGDDIAMMSIEFR